MASTADLVARNAAFAADEFSADLTMSDWGNLTVIGCVDARVDPAYVLGLAHGEALVIRNMGGRVTPSTLTTLAMLAQAQQTESSGVVGIVRTVVLLHHTGCSMTDLAAFPDLLAEYFEMPAGQLDTKSVRDPYGSVMVDIEVLRAHQHGLNVQVSGLVYDVGTGLVEVTVKPTRLGPS